MARFVNIIFMGMLPFFLLNGLNFKASNLSVDNGNTEGSTPIEMALVPMTVYLGSMTAASLLRILT